MIFKLLQYESLKYLSIKKGKAEINFRLTFFYTLYFTIYTHNFKLSLPTSTCATSAKTSSAKTAKSTTT